MEAGVEVVWEKRMSEERLQQENRNRDPSVAAHEAALQRDRLREGMPNAVAGD